MQGLLVVMFFILYGAYLMAKTSYYYLIKDSLIEISMEVVSIKRAPSSRTGIHYIYTYKCKWKEKDKYYRHRGYSIKQVGDVDLFLIDPKLGIIYEYDFQQDYSSFFGMILLLIGLGYLISLLVE